MHIRQIALVARELEPVAADLRAVLGLGEAFRDPGVAEFGLHNTVFPLASTFLEVVSPVRPGTTAGRLLDRRGSDGGYMVILQTADLDADRRRLARLGVRVVWEIALDDIATVHLHPRDVGGAIVSIDQPRPPEAWRWGGPDWTARRRTDVVRDIVSVTLAGADPSALAARWADVLGLPAPRAAGPGLEIALDPGAIRFIAGGPEEQIVAVGVGTTDRERALAAARARGLATDAGAVTIGGVRFELS